MATLDRVCAVVKRVVEERVRDKVTPTARLFDDKLLDSFGVINLVGELEQELGIVIPTESLTAVNFATVEDVARLVDSLGPTAS